MFSPNVQPKEEWLPLSKKEYADLPMDTGVPLEAVSSESEQELILKDSNLASGPSLIQKIKGNTRRVVENVIPDMMDNFETKSAPRRVERKFDGAEERAKFETKLSLFKGANVIENARKKMLALDNGTYKCRIAVGAVNQGTRHPHDFIIEADGEKVTYYFIDPEHSMGKQRRQSAVIRKGDIRPHVSTLVSLRMPRDGGDSEVSMIRFRTGFIEDSSLLKMSSQYEMARELADTGCLPEILENNKNEITFYLSLNENTAEISSRYVSKEDIDRALNGLSSARPIEGKLKSFQHIVSRGLILLESGVFVRKN